MRKRRGYTSTLSLDRRIDRLEEDVQSLAKSYQDLEVALESTLEDLTYIKQTLNKLDNEVKTLKTSVKKLWLGMK